MPIKFIPKYTITTKMTQYLLRIEVAKERVLHLPLTPKVLATLRETARLITTHYSTMIEGNRLEPNQVKQVIQYEGHFPGRERDEHEVKGYFTALKQVEKWAEERVFITEALIKTIHGLVMANGRSKVKATPYRDEQNVIRDSRTGTIFYLPPEAKDVPQLMQGFIQWISENRNLPGPILAGIAHYQFATIHPYYDGNGRTARLLTTLLMHLSGYDLKGIYSLEEYYARELEDYYSAISIGPSHNYYMGRAEADITPWLEYFLRGMTISFERVVDQMMLVEDENDQSKRLRQLDPKKRRALELLRKSENVTSRQIGELFGFKPRTSAKLCQTWVEEGFLEIVNPSNKNRCYRLSNNYGNN
ncbi:MAG: Adenosine monophosphate-protein transferase SoFic [Chlamydiae bacterium]|nr:Adenosine monophosphate-protein transferase SoFic [Chlamydiota bacterium]